MTSRRQNSIGLSVSTLGALFWVYLILNPFGNYPGLVLLKEASFLISGIAAVALLVGLQLSSKRSLSSFSAYVILLVVLITIQLTVVASEVWGQPPSYSLLAQRASILMLAVVVLTEMSRRGKMHPVAIERALLVLCWLAVAVFFATNLLLNPANYLDSRQFAVGGAYETPAFKFKTSLVIFGMFYFWVTFRLKGGPQNALLFAILLLALLWFGVGRAKLLAIIIGFLAIEYQIGKLSGLFAFIVSASILALTAVLSFSIYFPDTLQAVTQPFQDAFSVVLTRTKSGEVSADSRLIQTELAWTIITDHWLFGAGRLSNRWQDGFLGQVGRFYPSDIGLIGLWFVHGLFGIGLFLGIPYFAWKFARCTLCRKGPYRILFFAAVGWLVYNFAHSVTTGAAFFQPAPTLFFIYLIGEIRRATISDAAMEKITHG